MPRLSVPAPPTLNPAKSTESTEPTESTTTTGTPPGSNDPRLKSHSLEVRLQGLMTWLVGYDIESAFVVDSDGLALIHHEGEMPLMAAAAAIEHKWEQMSQRLNLAPEKAMVLHLNSGSFLHLLGTHTHWGRLCLGILGQQLLSRTSLGDIRTTFDRLVGERPGTADPIREARPTKEGERRPRGLRVVEFLQRYAPDPHAVLLRTSLRSGLSMESLNQPQDLTEQQVAHLERTACDLLGLESLNI